MKKAGLSKKQSIAIMIVVALNATMVGHTIAQPSEPARSAAALPGIPPTAPISAADKANVIAASVREMNKQYIFPDVAKRAGEALGAKLKAKEYDAISDGQALAKKLTEDLFALTKDAHIRYQFSAEPQQLGQEPTKAEIAAERLDAEQKNFGVDRVERLPGNIGYVELREFYPVELSGNTISAAMNLVAHSDALIIDLRRNIGGHPETVALMSSYLLNERKHLNSLAYRDTNNNEQSWSLNWVPGTRFGGTKPVYVLTSKRSASAAEEFAYNLKHLKRATIVGETTIGAANPGGSVELTPQFTLFIPNGRAINPITKTNWEGVGVEPDVKVPADDALRTAQLLALKGFVSKEKNQQRADMLGNRIAELEKSAPK